jgi:transcriptional regulator with XRE-family HTH domain
MVYGGSDIEAENLRKLLSSNIRANRKQLGISQERLAELVEVSTQTINDVECCRSWVSDKTMAKLAEALNIEIFQLFLPVLNPDEQDTGYSLSQLVLGLRQDLKTEICAYIDRRFNKFLNNRPLT